MHWWWSQSEIFIDLVRIPVGGLSASKELSMLMFNQESSPHATINTFILRLTSRSECERYERKGWLSALAVL